MHLLTILAFAIVFWQAEEPGRWVIVSEGDRAWTLAAVIGQVLLMGVATWLVGWRGRRLVARRDQDPEVAQHFHHLATVILRSFALLAFAATVFLTNWPRWFDLMHIHPAIQIVGDLAVLAPYMITLLVLWIILYPFDRALHGHDTLVVDAATADSDQGWRFSSYLDFHFRHYILIVAVPMSLILVAANMTRGYETQLQAWGGWAWTPDAALGVVAACVFIVSPVMLRRIWRTKPLGPGPLRERLEALCGRIGFRCREILVWNSDGIMINAAVMGIFAPVRYVLLSDALLTTMNTTQIEGVFGHEVGHIRHRHIQHFLLFAWVGWLVVAGLMEWLARCAIRAELAAESATLWIQTIGVVATMAYWAIGFGWLSRRFERQADVFGAASVTPEAADCRLPCGVHPDERTNLPRGKRVCTSGATRFADALNRVALLNGIPHEERSWRHSSIGSRIRFLHSLAGDPSRAAAFDRLVRCAKRIMLGMAMVGLLFTIWYLSAVEEPAIFRLQSGEV